MTSFSIERTAIEDCTVIHLNKFSDSRGFFVESYRKSWIPDSNEIVQMNFSQKTRGSLAGLHYHLHQSDYWFVPVGIARVNLFDLRVDSPTFKTLVTLDILSDTGLYIPPGVAHGFSAKTDLILTYLVDNYYNGDDELGLLWNDPDVNADWGFDAPILSNRDSSNPLLKDIVIWPKKEIK
jgi:dTDP-4-dehydrorhamnose 3,5-epimerase